MKRKGLTICALAMGAAAMIGAAFGQGADQGLNIAIATGGTGGSIIRSAAAWPTCCPNMCRGCRRPRA